ncbi:hypothetical protein [Meiothermus sp.]|uniref:glycosyltransferase n=1 Tax=Meiothermus sp. TaxID=1955249 RepID=UPI00307F9842
MRIAMLCYPGLGVDDCVTSLATAINPEAINGAANVFLLASEHEGFGQSGLEALATRVGGVPEWLTPEVGRLVEYGDLEAFSQAVVQLPTSPDLKQMRASARSYAQTYFNPERITMQYEEVYPLAVRDKTD